MDVVEDRPGDEAVRCGIRMYLFFGRERERDHFFNFFRKVHMGLI